MRQSILMPFARAAGGGSFVSAALLAKGLLDAGNSVRAIFPEEGQAPRLFRSYGIEVVIGAAPKVAPVSRTLKGVAKFVVGNFRTYWTAYCYLLKSHIDVVYCNDDTTILPWGLAARNHGMGCVWHVRTGRKGVLDALRIKVSDHLICISDYVSARFPERVVRAVIPNPVDLDKFRPVPDKQAARTSLGLEPNGILFVQLGRDVPWKRPEWSICALGAVLENGLDAKLIFLGAFSHERQKELLSHLPETMHDRVLFMGWVDVPEVYLAAANALLHPADGEHFGRIFIEAAACNVPVVATRTGAAPEIILSGTTGYLVDDFSGFVEAMQAVGDNKDKISDGMQWDVSRYRIDCVSERVNGLLLSLSKR